MSNDKTQPAHWDRTQWAGKEPTDKDIAEQGKTWDRSSMRPDDGDEQPDELQPVTPEATTPTKMEPDDRPTGLSGRGMPSGESHWADKERSQTDR